MQNVDAQGPSSCDLRTVEAGPGENPPPGEVGVQRGLPLLPLEDTRQADAWVFALLDQLL